MTDKPTIDSWQAAASKEVKGRDLTWQTAEGIPVKPLYTALLSDGSLAFASELKGLLAHPLLRRTADPLAVEDYLAWGYVPDHRCFIQGVEKLPAGHFRLLRHDASPSPPVEWWDVSFADRRAG